ncbi:hypothetical protein [Novosphingobium pentaromativorans]|uniref:hypothetical protein n=1 Tax=Novosphingobium pentaromativorans TaxID=205844 RepID=UPI001939BDDA|nr:hypothetical protein [Novosphingobium pentaromativorans]
MMLKAKQATIPICLIAALLNWQNSKARMPQTAIENAAEGPPMGHIAIAPMLGRMTHQKAKLGEKCLNM